MARNFDYKLIVIGSGAAGTAAALGAAKYVKKSQVAVVESGIWGGTTYALRSIPFMTAQHFAQTLTTARAAAKMGISSANLRYNYPTMLTWRNHTIRALGGGDKRALVDAGVDCFHGAARFLNPYEITIGNKRLTAPYYVLATGARVDLTEVAGAVEAGCFTPDNILNLNRPPKALLIIGGGATGCEIAQYFAMLGTKVILCEARDRLLPAEDPEVGVLLANYFQKVFGIKVLTNAHVDMIQVDQSARRVIFTQTNSDQASQQKASSNSIPHQKSVRVEAVVLATHPQPITDYGLENARVQFNKNGIVTDRGLQTTSKHIWAAGDCLGGESSLKKAAYEGQLTALNSLRHAKGLLNYSGLVRITNTFPMVAKVGLNETECSLQRLRGIQHVVAPLSLIPASKLYNFKTGFLKLSANRQGHIIGATIVSPHADLLAQELALAIRYELPLSNLKATPHTPMSWNEIIPTAVKQLKQK